MVDDGDENTVDICRVCRTEGTSERPLHYPCMCTGSIKYVHQECLTQWLKYSRKEYCELCHHKYTFMPIYHPDMPKRLPVGELSYGMLKNLVQAVRCWFHYTLVAIAWLGIVPLTACRIYRCLFQGTINSLLTLPLDMLSMDNLFFDCLHGGFIVGLTLCAFVSLVWLREQILHGGPPQWLNLDVDAGGGAGNNDNANNVQPQERADNGENAVAVEHHEEGGNEIAVERDQDQQPQPPVGMEENEPIGNENRAEEPPGPPPAAAPAPPQENQEDPNWQPFEWDRAAEELTWERLFGLDGSLIFLEHVFWVISLNTLFILVFAFSPYYVGHFAAFGLRILSYMRATYFEGLLLSLFGYLIVGIALFLMHQSCRILRLRKAHRILGMCYLVVKVFLLVLVEIGLFPLICGWWLDICSLRLFNASLRDRVQSFRTSPGTSMFLHWLVGMVYVFYFASFILLLREVLRPGVLWFLRNLNDPEFNPIQEMIQFPVYRHLRHSVASLVMFGVTVLLLVHYPIRIILFLWPSVLPYNIHLNIETPISELSLELLLLQVVLPALLEQSHARQALKVVAKWWCFGVGRLLGLTEYLLPAEELLRRDRNHNFVDPVPDINHNNFNHGVHPGVAIAAVAGEAPPAPDHIGNLRAEHQALLLGRGPTRIQPYRRPTWLPLRIIGLLVCLSGTLLLSSLVCLSLPVSVGRYVIWLLTGHQQTHELYTMACGLYACWVILRLSFMLFDYLPRGWPTFITAVKFWATVILKCVVVCVALTGVIPLLLGTLFQLVIVAPLRTTIDQSPLYFPWQDWAMGILHSKILCALIMMGPDWRLKRVFDQIYHDGFRNMNVRYIYVEVVVPAVTLLGLAIAIPYVVAHTLLPIYGVTLEEEVRFQRHIYPCLLLFVMMLTFLVWQFRQLRNLLTRIRNERYLVGQRLVNYERQAPREAEAHAQASPSE